MVSDTNELSQTDIEVSEDDYTRLRESVPYVPIDPYSSYLLGYPIVSDEIGKRLAHFIQKVTLITLPQQTFTSIDDADAQDFIRSSSTYATKSFTWLSGEYLDDITYQPQLEAFADLTQDRMVVYMKEHVELTAKVLFGNEVEIVHQNTGGAQYSELAGIYWPSFMGVGVGSHTVLLSYDEEDDQYTADVVFPEYSGDQYLFFEYADDATMVDFIEYCRSLPIHRITLKKGKNDTLMYYAHILPSEEIGVDESKAGSLASIAKKDITEYTLTDIEVLLHSSHSALGEAYNKEIEIEPDIGRWMPNNNAIPLPIIFLKEGISILGCSGRSLDTYLKDSPKYIMLSGPHSISHSFLPDAYEFGMPLDETNPIIQEGFVMEWQDGEKIPIKQIIYEDHNLRITLTYEQGYNNADSEFVLSQFTGELR